MILTKRTKLSLCQFLDLFSQDVIHILLEKHNIWTQGYSQLEISWALPKADKIAVEAFIDEIVATYGDLRNRVSPRYRFDERWEDFCKCILLDGFKIKVENKSVPFSGPLFCPFLLTAERHHQEGGRESLSALCEPLNDASDPGRKDAEEGKEAQHTEKPGFIPGCYLTAKPEHAPQTTHRQERWHLEKDHRHNHGKDHQGSKHAS